MRWDKEVIFHLRNLEKNKCAIKNLKERITETDEKKFRLKGLKIEDTKVQSSLDNSDLLLNLIVESEELRKQLREVMFEIKWIENGLQYLDKEEFKVLEEFYIKSNKCALIDLIKELNYSKSYIYNLRHKSIHKLANYLYGVY